MIYIGMRELMAMCATKVARGSSPYIGKASHTILEAIGMASFIILIMACIGTSLFVMVTLFWAKRVTCYSSLVILYNAMDGG
ncbi:Insulin-like receptor [Gossypium arboreum]|uniref:Insulin-like receptor n=1 Tax=Gossypium arboreum TaxID=29729 RepID=A0A0B0PTP8_GOSAR|nr:Insulin-like receptor [Gossypium arboreum]